MPETAIDRKSLIDRLQWNAGGTGFGVCAFANALLWGERTPQYPRGKDDLKSIVAISGPPEKYTDEELAKLVEFSDRKTADYDKNWKWRVGANLICIDKEFDGKRWLRKRMTWTMGPMWSPTLDDAIKTFDRKGV